MGPNTAQLLTALEAFFRQQGVARTYHIAYSGGMDSHVLLALCATLQAKLSLRLNAVHIAHHLSPHTDSWLAHCRATANLYAVPFTATALTPLPVKKNIEATLRKARYAALAACMQPNDMVLTAHHADDQAETVLLQLLRGASPKGLAAMPTLKVFADGWHGRPLLACQREILLDAANELGLKWVEDESNAQNEFARNYLRHQVLPLLKARWPALSQTIARSASHCAETHTHLTILTANTLAQVRGSREGTLSVVALLTLDAMTQRWLLRQWIRTSGYLPPSAKKLDTILNTVLTASIDRQPQVDWESVSVRRYQDDLYLLPIESMQHRHTLIWQLTQPLILSGLGCLIAQRVYGSGLKLPSNELTVRFRKGGERIMLPNRTHHTYLKNLFQTWQVPTWQRASIPLLYHDDTLIAVVGYAIAAGWQATEEEWGWQIVMS